jgi:hypothetical protein
MTGCSARNAGDLWTDSNAGIPPSGAGMVTSRR